MFAKHIVSSRTKTAIIIMKHILKSTIMKELIKFTDYKQILNSHSTYTSWLCDLNREKYEL